MFVAKIRTKPSEWSPLGVPLGYATAKDKHASLFASEQFYNKTLKPI